MNNKELSCKIASDIADMLEHGAYLHPDIGRDTEPSRILTRMEDMTLGNLNRYRAEQSLPTDSGESMTPYSCEPGIAY